MPPPFTFTTALSAAASRHAIRACALVAGLLACERATPQRAGASAVDTMALRARASFLADDMLAGRANGSPGQRIAASYIESELRRAGARGGAADGSFRQHVPLERVDYASSGTRLELQRGGARHTIPLGDFFMRASSRAAVRSVTGALVFIGRASDAAARATDSASLRGRIAVVAAGGDADSTAARLASAGAAAVIIFTTSPERYRRASALGITRHYLLDEPRSPDRSAARSPSAVPVVVAGPDAARTLGLTSADSTSRSARELPGTMTIRVSATITPLVADNIIGRLDGSDRVARDSVVILQAHYDHVGIGTPVRGDSIYNGFMDNAVGVAAVLAAADALADSARAGRLRRSVLFLLVTGEEGGLSGSRYYVSGPPVPLRQTVATFTLDLPTPLAPATRWLLESNDSALVRQARAAVSPRGWHVEGVPPTPTSDHWSFVTHGVPSAFVVADSGWTGVTPAQEEALIARWWTPHQPADEWHDDFPASGLARQAELLITLTMAFAGRK